MKRIVILCDGTWKAAEAPEPTNVVRLAQAMRPVDPEGVEQIPVYLEGMGTGRRGVTRIGRWVDRYVAGPLGLGLMDSVMEAYRHLVFLYEPGDAVFVFGYSRGAFAARSLVGFVRHAGLLPRDRLHRLPEAVDNYTRRFLGTPEERQRRNAEWRRIHSADVMVDPDDAEIYDRPEDAHPFRIAFLGVWDTVGALGVPSILTARPVLGRRFAFHDTALTPMVASARHAVSIDERRLSFGPTLWTNLDALNAGRDPAPYRERWFAGDHGSVGGGGRVRGLSSIALAWMIEGAAAAGLSFDPAVVARIRAEADPLAPPFTDDPPPGGRSAAILRALGRERDGPRDVALVHRAARERWARHPGPYRPGALRRLERLLEEWRG